jgi:hypothetical protein
MAAVEDTTVEATTDKVGRVQELVTPVVDISHQGLKGVRQV